MELRKRAYCVIASDSALLQEASAVESGDSTPVAGCSGPVPMVWAPRAARGGLARAVYTRWPVRGFPLAPYLVSFPCFLLVSLQHPLVSSGNPGETPWNSSFWGGSEPCLRLFWGQNRQNTGYFAGIPGKPRYTWKIPGYRADFLNFAPDFAPDQLSDSGKLASFPRETREKQNGAPNTLWFPWKLPETQSAGDPLVSLWVAGNPRTGQHARSAVRKRSTPYVELNNKFSAT